MLHGWALILRARGEQRRTGGEVQRVFSDEGHWWQAWSLEWVGPRTRGEGLSWQKTVLDDSLESLFCNVMGRNKKL